jgi:RimJ/RimL family protein N-acetyltransferase
MARAAQRKPARIETARLVLRRPRARDVKAIFRRYSSDAEVTRFLGWPRHHAVAQTRAFLEFSDGEWQRWPAGPFLIESRETGELLGGTGLGFETPYRASTGYVLARDAWGRGYATEALRAMAELARRVGVRRLYALCHPDHFASRHVLEKCGFAREALLRCHSEFPNLRAGEPADTLIYALVCESEEAAV